MADKFTTLRHARAIGERHPKAQASTKLVGLVLATYADGDTGRNIRPGLEDVPRAVDFWWRSGDGFSHAGVRAITSWME